MGQFSISDRLHVRHVAVGGLANNSYFLVPDEGAGLLIDAADDPATLLKCIGDDAVATIVTTHRHHDHIQALSAVASHTGAVAVSGTPDAEAIELATSVAQEKVWTGDTVDFGEYQLGVIGLVGHTPGSIALVADIPGSPTHIFTGDALFPGGPGRTTNDRDFRQLMDDLETKVFGRFDDDTVAWPGHGEPTTLGAERPHLAEWRARGW